MPHDDIRAVLDRRSPELMAMEGVAGVGEGTDGVESVVVVYVVRKADDLAARLPVEIDGWRVVIREVGEVTAPPARPKPHAT